MRSYVKHKTHMICRRCNRQSFNLTKRFCSNCKFGHSSKRRS